MNHPQNKHGPEQSVVHGRDFLTFASSSTSLSHSRGLPSSEGIINSAGFTALQHTMVKPGCVSKMSYPDTFQR